MNEAETIKEILKRVRQTDIKIRRRASGLLAGSYQSAFKGEGMVFSDFREYMPGDDIRSISWNLTAKTGRPYIKTFEAERESPLLLAVDVSRSMNFGGREASKREAVNQTAGFLAFCAQKSRDPLGLLLFAKEPELYIPPERGRRQALIVLRALCRQAVLAEGGAAQRKAPAAEGPAGSPARSAVPAPAPADLQAGLKKSGASVLGGLRQSRPRPLSQGERGTNFPAAFSFIRKTLKKRSRIFLFSDFCSQIFSANSSVENFKEGKRLLREPASRHDLVCVSVSDSLESRFPPFGLMDIEDLETGQILTIDASSPLFRRRFALAEKKRRERLNRLFAACGCESVWMKTGGDAFRPLIEFLQTRQKRERL